MNLRSAAGFFESNAVDRRFINSPFLVVDWTTTGVALSSVRSSGGRVALLQSLFAEWPKDLDPIQNPDQAGKWIRTVCDDAQLPASAVAISVPRRDLSIRLLELPSVSDDELGPLVALQVESRTQLTNQPVAWDCLAHPVTAGEAHRYVVLATIAKSVFDAICSVGQSAGWSNVIMTSGDLSIGTENARPDDAEDNWQIHVQANQVKLELSLYYNGLLVSSYATAMPAGGPDEAAMIVKSTTSRLMAGRPSAWQVQPASAAISISGPHAQPLADALQGYNIHAAVLAIDDRTPRALAVAQSIQQARGRIDFLRPRSADRSASLRRRRRMMAAAVAATVGMSAVVTMLLMHNSLDRELAQLEAERQQLQQFVDRGQSVVDQWSYVSRWQKDTLNSATEIGEFTAILPANDRLIVTRLQLENLVEAEDSMLRIEGLARNSAEVLGMNAAILESSERYELRPQGIEPAPDDGEFSSQFRIEVLLRDRHASRKEVQQ